VDEFLFFYLAANIITILVMNKRFHVHQQADIAKLLKETTRVNKVVVWCVVDFLLRFEIDNKVVHLQNEFKTLSFTINLSTK